NEGAGAAGGEFAFPIDASLGERAILVVESARNVRPEDAILDREIAEFERGEDDIFAHDTTSAAGAAIARCHTTRSSAGTKAAAGHCAQCPTMNSRYRPGVRSPAASSSTTTTMPAGTASL